MSFKEDVYVGGWKERLKQKSQERDREEGEYAKDCEYSDICECAKNQCVVKRRYECDKWHEWKYVDLKLLFEERKDDNNNYLFKF
jgi:hypothetical protein